MPVCSYIVYPKEDQQQDLLKRLNQENSCEAMLDDQERLIVLVTATDSQEENKELHEKLIQFPGLDALTLCFGNIQDKRKGELTHA